ncbi:MAG: DUF6879 family protein [Candidatus Saccharimonadales bacterium]
MNTIHGYDESGRVFNDYFTAARYSIFKLGVLQSYVGEDTSPSWQSWEMGNREESMRLIFDDPESRYADWMRLCNESRASLTRVQVTESPLTPYADWQLALFQEYQRQGAEQVFTVSADSLGASALPASDILIFDDRRVLQWTYVEGSQGQVNGAKTWDVMEGDTNTVASFLTLRQDIIDQAIPLSR